VRPRLRVRWGKIVLKVTGKKSLLRAEREKKKYAIAELASAAGVSERETKRIDKGGMPSLEQAARLCRVLGTPVESVFVFEFARPARGSSEPSSRILPLLSMMAGKSDPALQRRVVELVGKVSKTDLDAVLAEVARWKNKRLVAKCLAEIRREHRGSKEVKARIRLAFGKGKKR